METTNLSKRKLKVEFAVVFLLLLAVLGALFHGVFLPDQTLFSNDGPLGRVISDCHKLPDRFFGCWGDLNGIGFSGGAATPGISLGLQYLLKPVVFSKFYALISLLILGLGAWCFFTQIRLSRMACLLGGLAAALNSCFFSVSCWGVAAQSICAGMAFFAMAALADNTSPLRWWRVALAGFAVGMGVVEGADVGAIFSMYVATFLIYQTWISEGTPAKRVAVGAGRLILVVACAGMIAAQTVSSLVGTFIVGVVGTGQDVQTKEMRWDWATQWSLPVEETTALVVPGLFGYRMDTPNGGAYWGTVGRDPSVERYLENGRQGPAPRGFMRYAGGGYYAGVLVVVLAIWAIVESFRRKESIFSLTERKWLWFWLAIGIVSLLLAFGRFAPFYRIIYALPYFSTIRNPIKFIYLVSFALIVFFGYGVDGLYRRYMKAPASPSVPPPVNPARKAAAKSVAARNFQYEKRWLLGCWVVLGASLAAWGIYASEHQALLDYLHSVQFHDPAADAIATFSIWQVGWFVCFFALSIMLMRQLFAGNFTGSRAVWGGVALGAILVADLGRANLPWIIYWNYPEKYATNTIIEALRGRPWEHRVTMLGGQQPQNLPSLDRLYRLEWLQQQFPYYNIQTLDIPDMPRKPEDLAAYTKALTPPAGGLNYRALARVWQLTNTRYILGLADVIEPLNQEISRPDEQMRIVERFSIVPKPGEQMSTISAKLTATPDPNGYFALFEFTGALPRAKLFGNWQVDSDNQDVLARLASPSFDPLQTVLVSDPLPAGTPAVSTNQNTGTVDFTSYSPKDLSLKCNAPAASVLLLNDHYDKDWRVFVDGQPAKMLHCNFIMRGVLVPSGVHTVEFKYLPPYKLLYLTVAVMAASALLLLGVLVASGLSSRKNAQPAPVPAPAK